VAVFTASLTAILAMLNACADKNLLFLSTTTRRVLICRK